MESGPPQLPPHQAKPEGRAPTSNSPRSANSPAGTAATRAFPKPPALFPRLLMLCLRPETWPEMAQYPTRYTIVPLVLAILITALAVGTHASYSSWQSAKTFAAGYSAHYPDLEISSDGVLKAKGDLPHPIRFENGDQNATIYIDPTGKTTPDTLKSNAAMLITDKEIWIVGEDTSFHLAQLSSLTSMAMDPGTTKLINTQTLNAYLASNSLGMIASPIIVVGVLSTLGDVLWTAFTIFLICPLVMLAAAGSRAHSEGPDRRLILPRRAAYRMASAIMIPLVLLGGVLQVLGHPVAGLIGGQGAMLFWFFAAAGLAIWTGIMAKKMYGQPARR